VGAASLERFSGLLEALDSFLPAQLHIGHPRVADVLLAHKGAAGLWSNKPLAKTAQKALKLSLEAAVAEDVDARWTFDISETSVVAERYEDGIRETFPITADTVSNWRVRRVREGAMAAGLDTGTWKVQDTPIHGPFSLMEALRSVGSKGAQVSRYKGLGEMNPSELWETTLDPTVRALYRVDIMDAAAAETIFTDLMADNVSARRALIEKMCAGYKGPL
jgi:DNA gyrase/topoisomerase IV subunit B